MSKFRIKMKLQGFELEIEGAREDAALISRSIGQQMASLIKPTSGIIDVDSDDDDENRPSNRPPIVDVSPRKTRRKKPSNGSTADNDGPPAIDFKHSPEKFGNPRQQWKTSEKTLWLIYVLKEITGEDEVANSTLVNTFNKHFKQSGTVRSSNVSRDFGNFKSKERPPLIGENTSVNPPRWFLTEEGIRRAQGLVGDALGQSE